MASDVFGLVGTTVAGAFRVEAVVAEGGFAVVYRAYHEGFRAPVALKCLKIPQYFNDQQRTRFEHQFQAEAELLFKLSASIPTVVRPLHVEAVIAPDGSFMPFLALEWLEGETLDAVARRRREAGQPPFTLFELIPALLPVAKALERAHNFPGPEGPISIVHRDVKPENVFVARVAGQSVVKILDFGIGKAKSMASQVAGRASQEDAGVSSFTPAYGAPEQWVPKRYGQTGPWTDVWGLALTMVELLAGRPVVDGDQAAMMGTVLDASRRPTPRAEGVSVSDAVEAVFQRALALDPRDRYAHVGEFWGALVAAAGPEAQRLRSGQSGQFRAAGRSGTHAAVGASPEGLGRHNLIPDLETRAPLAAAPDLELAAPVRGAGRSGQWAAAPASRPLAASAAPAPDEAAAALPGQGSIEVDIISAPERQAPAQPAVPDRYDAPAKPPELAAAPAFLSAPREATTAETVRGFAIPAALVTAGIALTVLDGALAASSGEVFSLGPVKLAWLAAALALGGIALAGVRLLGRGAE